MRSRTRSRVDGLPLLVIRRDLHAAGIDLDVALRAARAGLWQQVLPGAWLRHAGESPATSGSRRRSACSARRRC